MFVVSDSCSRISANSLASRKALHITELRNSMILIRRKFEVWNSLPRILINTVAFHKAEGISKFGFTADKSGRPKHEQSAEAQPTTNS
jgi:hypothetical protein